MDDLKLNAIEIILPIFEKYKNESWVLSTKQIEEKVNNFSFFSNKKNKWKKLDANFEGPQIRELNGKWYNKHGTELPRFGLISGIVVDASRIYFLSENRSIDLAIVYISLTKLKEYLTINNQNTITINNGYSGNISMNISENEVDFLKEFINTFSNTISEELERRRKKEEERVKSLNENKSLILNELDKDSNGEVDVIEGNHDINTLLKKYQNNIIQIDRTYVQQFVKISSYLKTKKGNIQSIFLSIKDTPNQTVLNEYVEILKDDIHSYNLVLFNSLNMIVCLVEDDMITFYEIYEMFDKLNIFDSKHENDISHKLTNIGDGLEDLMYEVRRMGNKISNSIDHLSYVTEESNYKLQEQLSEIGSTLKVGNLISLINTYQNYKINKNTKSLGK